MILQDEELVQDYVTECREHLADIESHLLSIEEAGAGADPQLVNKVFRAAHSIKGGAGLFDLLKIKELAHKTENVLGMIRAREMTPTAEVVNILLLAFDRLRDLIHHIHESNQADISDIAVALTGLTSSSLPKDRKATVAQELEVPLPDPKARASIRASMFDFDRAEQRQQAVYLIDCDLTHDVRALGHNPLEVLAALGSCGSILDSSVDMRGKGRGQAEARGKPTLYVLYATDVEPGHISNISHVPIHRIYPVNATQIAGHKRPRAMSVSTLPRPIVPRISIPATPLPGIPAGVSASLQRSDSTLNSIGADLTSETSGLKLASADAPVCPIAAPAMSALSAAFSAANRLGDPTISPPAGTKDSLAGDTTLRVNVALLELLMNLAGELVLGRNQLNDAIARSDLDAIRLGGQRVGAVTSELQQTIMQTRLQPIGNVFNKFPRMVRDLCRGADKEIQLEVSGKEVETDKTIVEGLADPLVHMVRNAVDHGIEPVQERARLNKHPIGKVTLRASHEAGQVVVEVGDDGRGINPQRIAAGAIQRGLITAEQARSMSDNELLSLIFQPGMSTAANVTELSGRGVGMDVVKTNIDRLGGKVEIESQPGKGTIFRIKLPLTLAIIPSLLVAVAGERFAIPQDNVGELLCVPAAQIKDRVEVVGGAEVLRLRGELIPVVNLSQVLGMDRWYHDPRSGNRCKERRSRIADRRSRRHPADSTAVSTAQNACQTTEPRTGEDRRYHAASDRNIVVVAAGTLRYGLVVDELHDTMEIVVKPLGRHLQRLREYAGATILGDGKIALILDANGLATKARISSMAATARARQLAQEAQRATLQDTVALLIFFNAADEPCGVPLADVARVEHVLVDQIESLGGRRSMRHRGRTLPLVTLQDVAQVGCLGPEQARVVLVFEAAGRQVGLLAAMPIDAVDAAVVIDRDTLRQKGVLGSAVVEGRTTLIVDLCEVVEATYPDWIKEPTAAPLASSQAPTILLAEDSDFFRSQVCKSIEAEGYRVLAVEDGQAAWDMLAEQGQSVRLVVTDVEMPRLGGLELTARIRADRRFAQLPVVALSSLAGEDDMARGTAAGVSEYLVKLDRQKLIEAIGRLLGQETDAQP